MPRPTHDLHLDFETYSDLDLTKVGVHRYVADPSFRILCTAWKFAGRATLKAIGAPTRQLVELLQNSSVRTHAWNAAFETAVLARLGITPANTISCSMQRSLSYGLPAKLELAAAALGQAAQKDMQGRKLMLRMSRPLKPGAPPWTVADYERLADYCVKDVEAEAAISEIIPQLQPDEIELSRLDAAMNNDGELGIDLERVCTLQCIAEAAEKADKARCAELTGGAVTSPGTQTARLLKWLAEAGLKLEDVGRATVEDALNDTLWSPQSGVKEVLQIRLRMAKASNAKLARMIEMSDPTTQALRGQFQFTGAGRTGRWSGRGVQVQNMPRVPKHFSPELFYEMAAAAVHDDVHNFDAITPAPGAGLRVWSLRSCLKATDETQRFVEFRLFPDRSPGPGLAGRAAGHPGGVRGRGGRLCLGGAAIRFQRPAAGKSAGARPRLRHGGYKAQGDRLEGLRGAAGAGHTPSGLRSLWRAAQPRIVDFWREMEFAAKQAVLRRGTVVPAGGSGVALHLHRQDLADAAAVGTDAILPKPAARPRDREHCRTWGPSWGDGRNSGRGAANWRRTRRRQLRETSWGARCCAGFAGRG